LKIVAKPIDMVAWFTKDGCPNPVRFRFENEENTYSTIKVDRVITKDTERLAGNSMIVFKCQSIIGSSEMVYEIKYELSTCKWVLFKV